MALSDATSMSPSADLVKGSRLVAKSRISTASGSRQLQSVNPSFTGSPAVKAHDSIGHEINRQIALLEAGEEVVQETRGFDEDRAETYALRSKEDAPDYRYMPDPNLPPLLLDQVCL